MKHTAPSRNPWPLAIIATFVIFATGLAAWITFAVGQKMDLVRADYYDQEIRYQQQIDRENRTHPFQGELAIAYHPVERCITIALPAAHATQEPTGRIHLYRPSDASLDHVVQLAVNSEGAQRLDARELRPGLWKVRLCWSVRGDEYYFDQPIVVAPSHS